MVEKIKEVVKEYEQRLRGMPCVPKLSYGRPMLREDGGPNRMFFSYLFTEQALAIQFLKDVGLLRSKVQCNNCGRDMKWYVDSSSNEGFRWRCRRMVGGAKCSESRSIKHGSWFHQSNLTFLEILNLTYDIVRREPAHHIQNEHCFGNHTITDWGMFCRETMLVFMEGCSEKIGGPDKTVEIDESKFGRRNYHRGHPVKGQWVFGGVERGSGRTFLVPVPDRTADTLMAIIRAWIEPGTTVISDCWGAYLDLDSQGFTHRTVNRSISFVDPDTGDHTNTILSTWHRVKVFLGHYNRADDYECHLAHYMFMARCKALGVPPFLQFLHIVANIDWTMCDVPRSSDSAT
jgi:transposase-like protein